MSDISKMAVEASEYSHDDKMRQRAYAVAAALEIINTRAGTSGQASINIEYELSKLSDYADKIQAALAKA
ncbi:hypothetical protein ABLT21_08345 [Pseudomonas aeruginosa]